MVLVDFGYPLGGRGNRVSLAEDCLSGHTGGTRGGIVHALSKKTVAMIEGELTREQRLPRRRDDSTGLHPQVQFCFEGILPRRCGCSVLVYCGSSYNVQVFVLCKNHRAVLFRTH